MRGPAVLVGVALVALLLVLSGPLSIRFGGPGDGPGGDTKGSTQGPSPDTGNGTEPPPNGPAPVVPPGPTPPAPVTEPPEIKEPLVIVVKKERNTDEMASYFINGKKVSLEKAVQMAKEAVDRKREVKVVEERTSTQGRFEELIKRLREEGLEPAVKRYPVKE